MTITNTFKKTNPVYLFIATLLQSLALSAQPTFNATVPPVGASYNMYTCSSTITAATEGTNQTWNYANATTNLLLYVEWITYNSVSQLLKDSFPDATLARESYLGGNAIETKFFLENGTNWLNFGSKNSGNAWTMHHPPKTEHKNTMNFGEFVQLNNGYATTYVGSGTLTTPFDTYTDAILLEQYTPGDSDTLYYFYSCTPYLQPLMNFVKEGGTGVTKNKFFYDPVNTTSISKISNSFAANIFPNPSNGSISIAFEKPKDVQLTVYSLLGEELYTNSIIATDNQSVDLSFLPNGVYLLKLENENSIYIQKLVVQKP